MPPNEKVCFLRSPGYQGHILLFDPKLNRVTMTLKGLDAQVHFWFIPELIGDVNAAMIKPSRPADWPADQDWTVDVAGSDILAIGYVGELVSITELSYRT